MKRSKTKKYTLKVIGYADYEMVSEMEISKREFDVQIKALREQINEPIPEDMDEESYVSICEDVFDYDYESYTQITYCFSVSNTNVFLTARECKEGYHFKR